MRRRVSILCIVGLGCGRVGFDPAGDARVSDEQIVELPLDRYTPREPLVDFPLLVSLDKTRIDKRRLADDASDVWFSDASGTITYPREIEQVGLPDEPLVAWVKVPRYEAGTSIFLHYGGETRPSVPREAWAASYLGVWHMRDATDATTFAHDGELVASASAPGVIGMGRRFVAADESYMRVADAPTLTVTNFTVSAWVYVDAAVVGYSALIGREVGGTSINDFNLNVVDAVAACSTSFDLTTSHEISGGMVAAGRWNHLAGTYDGANITLYVDGTLVGTETETRMPQHSANPLLFGADRNNPADATPVGIPDDDWLDGILDEVRLENVARSAAWIAADASSVRDEIIRYPAR